MNAFANATILFNNVVVEIFNTLVVLLIPKPSLDNIVVDVRFISIIAIARMLPF